MARAWKLRFEHLRRALFLVFLVTAYFFIPTNLNFHSFRFVIRIEPGKIQVPLVLGIANAGSELDRVSIEIGTIVDKLNANIPNGIF